MEKRNKHFKASLMLVAALMISFGVGCGKDKKEINDGRRGFTPRCDINDINCINNSGGSFNNSDKLASGLGESDGFFNSTRIQLALNIYRAAANSNNAELPIEAEGTLYVDRNESSSLYNCAIERGEYIVLPDGTGVRGQNFFLNQVPLMARSLHSDVELRLTFNGVTDVSEEGELYSCVQDNRNETFANELLGELRVEAVRYRNGAWINCDRGFGDLTLQITGDQDLSCNF